LLIPLKDACKSKTDVADLIAKLFRDIKTKQALRDFEVAKTLTKGKKPTSFVRRSLLAAARAT
jgi:hypothetical protein